MSPPPRCEIQWSLTSPDQPCPNPADVVIADPDGNEAQVCTPHYHHALRCFDGLLRASI
jgi:hypothetical protein